MHIVKEEESLRPSVQTFIDKSVESRLLAVTGRWFSVITPPIFTGALVWSVATVASTDKDIEVMKNQVNGVEHRLSSTEGNVDALKDFIAQCRVAREKDLGELKQRISTLEAQSKTLLDSSDRQEDKLDKIFERLSSLRGGG